MEVEQLTVRKDKAEKEYQAYREALKTKKDSDIQQYLRDMASVYGHMRHGRKAIDVFSAIPKAGLNEDGDPKLAICRADAKHVQLYKHGDTGGATFSPDNNFRYYQGPRSFDVQLPDKSFHWPEDVYKRNSIRTAVPIIPAKFIPRHGLHNYYILWEALKWEQIPRDPILLKRVTPNIFVTLAAWDLTDLEVAVLKGRL